jgi:IS30 family transposase
VSHETIYQTLYVQARGGLRKELVAYLRRGHAKRRPRGHSNYNGQGRLRDTINISERPPEANDRAVPGHWEGDLLFGKGMTAIATLVERQSRYLMLIALPDGHRAELVADALAERIVALPDELRRSLTWGQGKEMAAHARFSIETGLPVYFCDPRSPLAARVEREHQRATAPVLPQTHQPRPLHPGRPRHRRRRAQRQTSTNPRLAETIRSTRPSVAMTP